MEFERPAEPTSPVIALLPLASESQQPYVSELLSFTLDRLHKVPSSSCLLLNAIKIRTLMLRLFNSYEESLFFIAAILL